MDMEDPSKVSLVLASITFLTLNDLNQPGLIKDHGQQVRASENFG